MPAFRDNLTDGQVGELASYLRRQFAPDKPAWSNIHATIGRIRQQMAR
jgi:nicotinate dehydrogenase subunit B